MDDHSFYLALFATAATAFCGIVSYFRSKQALAHLDKSEKMS
ncbi:hypothetical protein SAMN04488502_101399 [Dendrosporobacter quercicolus]|uniref:Uncharacterized protein n=1 Tax=Dendrosporobacter quercicolus TaxID=146817 RepID=A0A1G9LMR9_9FIRM|nr:hypothetical protein [Dendrosporobacter quercicolus]SDL63087.1 hypothetical protein SAMN04488502_101399 [Dendrosporobacter quercicolus]